MHPLRGGDVAITAIAATPPTDHGATVRQDPHDAERPSSPSALAFPRWGGRSPQLTWTFAFEFEDVERDFGASPVSLTVDWVDMGEASWHRMAGRGASALAFAQPIESSVYFFEHHRYDAVDLEIVEQGGSQIRGLADVRGDIDGLGIEALHVDGWLEFEGIIVHLTDAPPSLAAAEQRLSAFTDTAGLVGVRTSHNFRFSPAAIAR